MSEIAFILVLVIGMLGPGIYIGIRSKRWHLLWVFLTFFVCFGFWEWHATATTGMTVSQQVWEFSQAEPVGFWVCMGALLVAWIGLLVHFAAKKI